MVLVWITGFSGAGKTTVSKNLIDSLKKDRGITPLLLDGDELREALSVTGAYTKEDRLKLAYTYAKLGNLFYRQGFFVIVSTISMFEEVRQWNRKNNIDYLEVYLKVSGDERVRRDPKGLYASKVGDMAALEAGYEEPQNSDLLFDGDDGLSPEQIACEIVSFLNLSKRKS